MLFDHFINAFKTALACLAGFIIADLLHLNSSMWIIITIIVVMSSVVHLGGALQKAYLRFLGTLVGAGIGAVTLLFFPTDNIAVMSAVITLSAFTFSYIGGTSPSMAQAMTLGSVTVPIVLLTPHATLMTAFTRVSEIILGLFIALLVNFFVFPIHAKHNFEKILVKNMKILNRYYLAAYAQQHKKCALFEKAMMDIFAKTEQLLDDATYEPGVDKKRYNDILLHQKRLFRGISLLEYFSSPSLQAFIAQELNTLMNLALPAEFESAYPP